MPSMLSKFRGCLCGVAIGDAMGMPFEMMTPKEIIAATEGRGADRFYDAIQTRIKGTMKLKAGDTTDDWQLTRAIAIAISRAKGLDIPAIVEEHIKEYDLSTLGWGKSTETAIKEMKEFKTGSEQKLWECRVFQLRRAIQAAIADTPGTGNGVAMKIAPVALFLFDSSIGWLCQNVISIGELTHRDPRASYAAVAISLIIQMAISQDKINTYHLVNQQLFTNTLTDLEIGRRRSHQAFPGRSLSGKIIDLLASDLWQKDLDTLVKEIGTGCFCLESVPFSIAMFLRNPNNFAEGLWETVTCGGDTDTNAAMVGAMIGANVGLEGIPPEWIRKVPACQEAMVLADQLYELVQANRLHELAKKE